MFETMSRESLSAGGAYSTVREPLKYIPGRGSWLIAEAASRPGTDWLAASGVQNLFRSHQPIMAACEGRD